MAVQLYFKGNLEIKHISYNTRNIDDMVNEPTRIWEPKSDESVSNKKKNSNERIERDN